MKRWCQRGASSGGRHHDCYGGSFSEESSIGFEKQTALRSLGIYMEEDPSRSGAGELGNGDEGEEEEDHDEGEGEAAESSRDGEEGCDEGWLQLGMGVGITPSISRRSPASSSFPTTRAEFGGALLTDMKLFTSRPTEEWRSTATRRILPETAGVLTAVFPPPPPHHGLFYRRDTPWRYRNTGAPAMGVASPTFWPPPQYTFWPFVYPLAGSALPSGELRVVNLSQRPPAGVWFLLQASQNQVKEPFLPQVSKSYLRIKDGRMTVRLLKKYLVSKLGLEDESEVEIWCNGQPLLPFLALQHVRDNIWRSREAPRSLRLLPASSGGEHLMTLQYGRSS